MWAIKKKARRKVQPRVRDASFITNAMALEQAARLAAGIGNLPTYRCGVAANPSWVPQRMLVDTGSGDDLMAKNWIPRSVLDGRPFGQASAPLYSQRAHRR